jgi:ATP/maltotriose-dependent transcriptional regulator MalT
MIGRRVELERVRALLRDGSSGVVLAGPAGVGKTRLATEALALAPEYGYATLRVSATQAAASLPLGAFAAFLPDLVAGAERADMLQQTARAILDLGNGRPVAVLVDDAHLLDEASAALTHQLAMAPRVFLVATIRSGEPASDAIVALWKDGLAERLEVKPLTLTDVAELLTNVLGSPADQATARLLHDRTEGNVLFLRELVVASVDAGVLREEGRLWRLSGKVPASERLVELVEARLKGLAEADRQCVLALAIGEPLGLDLVRHVAGPADVDELARRGLVRIEEQHRRLDVRLGHPLYGEVLRARLPPCRTGP